MLKCKPVSTKQQDIDNIVFRGRVLWRNLSAWLNRYLIVKTLKADGELEAVVIDRLHSVTGNFTDLIRTFFGDKAADDYTILLSNYINLFIDLINALVEGNSRGADEIVKQIYQNAGESAEFLSNLNPYWDKNTMENYNINFTNMTLNEINSFISKNYKDSFNIYERLISYSSSIGDFMAQGIKDYLIYNLQKPTPVIPPTIE
ncbi:MAG: hypothetical protein AB9836_08240 [Aminipila sp.]